MAIILSYITNLITHTISTLGYAGVGFLMAVQTVAIPIPSEIILPFAGFLVYTGKFNIWLVALSGSLGSCLGASIAYYIGFKGGRPLVEKYGKFIFISKHDLELADKFFAKYGALAAFLGMTLPVFRSFIAFPAGISKVPIKKFLLYVFAGSFVWSLLLSYLGMVLGANWVSLREKFKGLDYVILAVIILGAAFWVYRHWKNRK
ncbi:MAG: DedA family protein [Candidatus Doudnabacteria bacterium]|nr:DedA family protein [Candidatus Doudnabacteria bacterium]